MQSNQKKMISEFVKEARLAKGYTQKELSELSNISIRSIQRIENGEILPRSYTLKTLAGILGLSFEELQGSSASEDSLKPGSVQKSSFRINKSQKIIVSITIVLLTILLSLAFISLSPGFPETHFEFFMYYAVIFLVIGFILTVIWRTRS